MTRHPADKFIRLFPREDIPDVLSSLLEASKSLQKKTAHDHENWISRRLYGRVKRLFPFRNGPLDIWLQPEIVGTDLDEDKASGQIDFLVSRGLGAEVYFAIEAKRLRVRLTSGKLDAGNDDYVNEGMMRFITAQYAPFMNTGAMLGYVYDGNLQKARSGVAGYIEREAAALSLIGRFVRSSILPKKPIDETQHALKNRPFTIYHLFLAV
ncbi:MAG: hypothetical protein SWH78_05855 [Thermodesulfobacteriota bacterium]|nr:hypothetical protein [Thermodesulfobacteriota bacterium]